MIPKIIHACWFGTMSIPEEHKAYMEGWEKLHPDWQVMFWSEENFMPLCDNSQFAKDALANKKYAFFSDYARLEVLYKYGGVYLDTDVEILKPLDEFLNCNLFMGYIYDCSIGTAVIGASKGNPILKEWIAKIEGDYLKTKQFEVNNNWTTEYFINNLPNFRLNGKRQSLAGGIELYPKEYFERRKTNKKSNGGYSFHHCYGSWRVKGKEHLFIKNTVKLFAQLFIGKNNFYTLNLNRRAKGEKYYSLYKQTIKEEKKAKKYESINN